MIPTFKGIYFQHIFKEANGDTDHMSKQALWATKGRVSYFTWDGKKAGPALQSGCLLIPLWASLSICILAGQFFFLVWI